MVEIQTIALNRSCPSSGHHRSVYKAVNMHHYQRVDHGVAGSTRGAFRSGREVRPNATTTMNVNFRGSEMDKRYPGSLSSDRYATDSSLFSSTKDSDSFPSSSDSLGKGTPGKSSWPLGASSLDEGEEEDEHDKVFQKDLQSHGVDWKGALNLFTLILIALGLLMLFAGYPVLHALQTKELSNLGAYNLGGTNGTGQVPFLPPILRLVDADTPSNALRWTSPQHNLPYHLVFSDEFEQEGRTFWPGDDPFWEAVNIWYGATADYEWNHPEQINTTNGHLLFTMEEKPINNLNFRSGMLQSWNKFCFQGGYIEFSVVLPGSPTEVGWWPGLWLQGNLARAGYLGTTDGMWPYSYEACDSGILPNQTARGRTGYSEVSTYRHSDGKTGLSWNNGQRTPSCTCPGEDHPGPNVRKGRCAPELDILEAQIRDQSAGQSSQTLQIGPFDPAFEWDDSSSTIHNRSTTVFNSFKGNTYQQSNSALSDIPDKAYLRTGNEWTTFGVEYSPDFTEAGNGFVTWYMDGVPTWTLRERSIGPRPEIDMSQRFVPREALSIVMNLHLSRGFQADLDFDTLQFPATMKVDYVRVYQQDALPDRVSCDPEEYPTSEYIERHKDVYTNANYTTWPKAWPRNRLRDGGC